MACGCPDAVVYTLRSRVSRELSKVRAIKAATGLFNTATQEVIGNAGADLDAAANLIPTPVPINYLDLLQYLTCPLTPLAIGLELSDIQSLDPNVALAKVKNLKTGEVENSRKNYESYLASSTNSDLVKTARKYALELLRMEFNSASFTEAVIISATVLAVCGQEEYQAGPYASFANEIVDFSFQNGVPSGLSQNAAAIVQKILNAERKFEQLRKAVL